jgi:hypothetical protein
MIFPHTLCLAGNELIPRLSENTTSAIQILYKKGAWNKVVKLTSNGLEVIPINTNKGSSINDVTALGGEGVSMIS